MIKSDEIAVTVEPSPTPEPTEEPEPTAEPEPEVEMVWIPSSGSRYHSSSTCSNMNNPTQVTLDEAIAMGYTPCQRCH